MRSSITAIASAFALAALLAACSTPAAPDTGGGSAEAAPPADEATAFCEEFTANGGTAATVGVVPVFYPKEDLVTAVQSTLTAMGDIVPPAEIAEAWGAEKAYYEEVLAAAEDLEPGARLADPDLAAGDPEQYDVIVDYFFEHCA